MAEKKNTSGGKKDPRDEVRRGSSSAGRGSSSASRPDSKSASSSSKNTSRPASKSASGASKSTSGKSGSVSSKKASGSSGSKSPSRQISKGSSKSSPKNSSSKKRTAKKKNIIPRGNDDRSRIIRTCIKLFLVLLAVLLLVAAWRNRVEWSCANIVQCANDTPEMVGIGDGFPVSVVGSDVLAEDELAGGVAVLTDTALTVYNTSSKQVLSRAHYFSSPAMKSAGRYALLTDIGGTRYLLEAVSETLTSGTTDMPIIGGAVSRSGRFTIITQGSSYSTSKLSMVEVFDRSGEPLHIWHSAYYYIIDAALSADGKYLAMAGVAAKDGSLYSCVILHKVGKEGNLAEIELPGSLCLSLEFTNTGLLYAVCDNKLVIIDDNGSNIEQITYAGDLQAYDISYETGAAVYTSASPDAEAGTLSLYDSRGLLRWNREVPLHAIAVSLNEHGCCVLGRGGMTAFSLIGEKLGDWEAAVSADDVLMIGSKAYMIEGISVSQINLNRSDSTDDK